MKTKIELSCIEADVASSLYEVKNLVTCLKLACIELKVKHSGTDGSHSWITVTDQSSPHELYQIFELKRKVSLLCDQLESTKK